MRFNETENSGAGRRFKRRLGSIAASVIAVCLAGPAFAADKVVFLTNWFAQAEHGGFYEAKALGLYDKAGLDVEIKMGGPQVNGMQLLLAGEADVILGYDFQVLDAVEKNLPAVVVAASYQYDLQGMMTHDNVKTFEGVKDKTILVASSGYQSWWPWLKDMYKLSNDQTKPYTFNLQPFFADKDIVQQSYPSSEPYQALEKGVPVNFYLFADYGYPPYGAAVVTTQKMVSGKPDVLKRFVAASMEGWKQYMVNPGPGNVLIKADNPKQTEGQINFAIKRMTELKILSGKEGVPVGTMTDARWKASYDYMTKAGILKPSTDVHRAYTLEFVKGLTAVAN